jgi:hypothetical protein
MKKKILRPGRREKKNRDIDNCRKAGKSEDTPAVFLFILRHAIY